MTTSLLTRFGMGRPMSLGLRSLILRFLRRANPGDITIRHHHTRERFTLHSFRHRGYWDLGKQREYHTMRLFATIIADGDFVINIGGHIGYTALYFSNLVGALRPCQSCSSRARQPAVPSRERARSFRMFVWSRKPSPILKRSATLYTEDLSGQNNSLIRALWCLRSKYARDPDWPSSRGKPLRPLHDARRIPETPAGLGCPSFVKINVEGSELSVLQGMAKVLDAPEITLMIEVTEQHRAVFEVLHGAGFRMFTPRMKRIESAVDLEGNVFCFKPGARTTAARVRRSIAGNP